MPAATAAPLARLLDGQPRLREHLATLPRAAASDAPLLLVGEPGSGRTALARAIHASGPRAEGPLVEVDPGSIPATLFESELFGHRPGAFTGATESRPGRVERAEGGTLLLDHVEELPVLVQPKLLRLVSEGTYSPLGGRERRADVRFLSIGAEDLLERIDRGAFREDLYYRLEVLAFRVPPLRERPEDLPGLVDRILDDLAVRFRGGTGSPHSPSIPLSPRGERGTPPPEPRADPPPERGASDFGDEEERGASDFGSGDFGSAVEETPELLRERPRMDPPAPLARQPAAAQERPGAGPHPGEPRRAPGAGAPRGRDAPPRPLEVVEEEEIRRALAYTRGHQGEAARLLGISRKGLWQKRKRYGIR